MLKSVPLLEIQNGQVPARRAAGDAEAVPSTAAMPGPQLGRLGESIGIAPPSLDARRFRAVGFDRERREAQLAIGERGAQGIASGDGVSQLRPRAQLTFR